MLNRTVTRALTGATRVDRSDRIFASPRRVRFVETELGFPRAAAQEVVPEILAIAGRYPVNFPIEVRFVAADDAFLSPSSGRDTVYIAAHVYRGMAWEPFFRAIHDVGERHGARPHWGKRHFHDAASLGPLYGEGFERFRAVRDRLDPDRRFANAYVRRVLGP
jgi:L-gulonolactone oxidase